MGARKISGLKDRLHFSMKYLGIILLLSGTFLNGYSQLKDEHNIELDLLIEDLKRNKADQALWELVGPTSIDFHNMGLVDEVLFNPEQEEDYLLSPNHGGLWKNRQTGNSWENVSDDLLLPGIAATEMIRNPFDNNHIIASTGSGEYGTNYGYGIIESFDNGESWQVMSGFPNNLYTQVNRVIYDPYDSIQANGLTLYAITKTKIYKSENTGLSWTEIENGPIELYEILHNEYIDIEIDNQGDIYLTSIHIYGFNGQVFKSQNGQWQNLNPGYSNFDSLQRARITKSVEGKIFLLADTQHDGRRIFKSYDYGNTWEFMRNTPNNGFKNEIEYSPESNIVYVGGINIRVFYDEAPYPLDTIFPLHVDIRDFEIMGIDSAGYEHVLTATDGGALLIKTNIHNISDYQQ
jgi:hypothetical protein